MTEDELARDVRAVLTKVRQGTEIVIEQNHELRVPRRRFK
jgi:hypothetical protein